MSKRGGKNKKDKPGSPTIENRKARHQYAISDTLECGIELVGTEVKSIRDGRVSLGEGYVRANEDPVSLTLYAVHIGEYSPAGSSRQHAYIRPRRLLAHKREIRKLAINTRDKGVTIVPLKMYFVNGRCKVLIGVGVGKGKSDKRQDLAKREAKRDMDRAMSKRMGG